MLKQQRCVNAETFLSFFLRALDNEVSGLAKHVWFVGARVGLSREKSVHSGSKCTGHIVAGLIHSLLSWNGSNSKRTSKESKWSSELHGDLGVFGGCELKNVKRDFEWAFICHA